MKIQFAVSPCSLGSILVAASDRGVCAITISDNREILVEDLHRRFPRAEFVTGTNLVEGIDGFQATVEQVIRFVEDLEPFDQFKLPLDLHGTDFQKQVWKLLCEIPFGKTVTYLDLAQRLGQPKAARAVAQACGANSIAVVIPCHRVIRSDGSLSGYRWGVERKAALLKKERLALEK